MSNFDRTGTEQQRTERGELIQQNIAIKGEETAALIMEYGADDNSPFAIDNESSSENHVDFDTTTAPQNKEMETTEVTDLPSLKPDTKAVIRAERRAAAEERNAAFDKYKRGEFTTDQL